MTIHITSSLFLLNIIYVSNKCVQGTGDINKSTARPKEVSRMDGLNITQVAMGYSHTLLLCDDSSDEVKTKLASMPTFDP